MLFQSILWYAPPTHLKGLNSKGKDAAVVLFVL